MLGRKSFLIISTRMASQALSFISMMFITRFLGADLFGSVVWSMAFIGMFNAFADLGFSNAHIKRMSEGLDPDDCFSTYVSVRLALIGVTVVASLSALFLWTIVLNHRLVDSTYMIVGLFVLYYVLFDLASIAMTTFDARLRTAKSQLTYFADPLLRVPFVIFVCLTRGTAEELAFAYVLGAIGIFSVGFILLRNDGLKWKKPTLFKSYLSYAAPLALMSFIGTIWSYSDRFLLGFFGTKSDVGYYYGSLSVVTMMTVFSAAVATVGFPAFSQLLLDGKKDVVREKTMQAERYSAFFVFPVAIILVLFPYAAAKIVLGSEFEAAGQSLWILAVSYAIMIINTAKYYQILAANRPHTVLYVTLLTMGINFVLILALVPGSILGIKLAGLSFKGAAIASLAANSVAFVIYQVLAWEISQSKVNHHLAIQAGAGVLVGAVLFFLNGYWPVSHIQDLAAYGLMCLGLYLGVLYVIKELTKDDIRFFLDAANLRNFWKNFKEELRMK